LQFVTYKTENYHIKLQIIRKRTYIKTFIHIQTNSTVVKRLL